MNARSPFPKSLLPALGFVVGLAALTDGREPPVEAIPREVFRERRARLLDRFEAKERPLIVRAGSRPPGEHDVDFRVASDFYYLTGVDVSGAELWLWRTGEGALRDVLLLPKRTSTQARWESPFLHADDPRAKQLGFEWVAPASQSSRDRLGKGLEGPLEPGSEIVRLRLTKDAHEIARLQRAIDITGAALVEAMRSVEPGMDEQEVDALIRYVFRREGARRAAFPSIVGSGPNTCILHYARNERVMRAGDLVLCDVGAEYDRYAADVTRTFPVSGRFSDRQKEVYRAVLDAQAAGIAAVRPGATLRGVHDAAARVLQERGLRRYFFHSTSHWLGLDVHDPGLRGVRLAPGMVLTVEPGAYIDQEGIGVRIEDDVLVTETGCEVLSRNIPRAIDEIEALMAERGVGNAPLRPHPPKAGPPTEPKKQGPIGPF